MYKKIIDILNNIANLVQPVLNLAKTKNLKSKLPRNYKEERVYISGIIIDVLMQRISVRNALLKFPKDLDDPSSIAAYHALIHYEADEDLRKKDALFKQEQDDYMVYIIETFKNGDELPQNIINSYKDFYEWSPSLFSNTKKGIWSKLKRVINI